MSSSLLASARLRYHRDLLGNVLGHRGSSYTNADKDSKTSEAIANLLGDEVARSIAKRPLTVTASGQVLGARFTDHTLHFVKAVFSSLMAVRPGDWEYAKEKKISHFAQYAHLAKLEELAKRDLELRSVLGTDYLVKSDIAVYRDPIHLQHLSGDPPLVLPSDGQLAQKTLLFARSTTQPLPLLHASISCKWTIRSDRSQNSRTEGLNLIRNRKGPTPHIAVVTGEPLPTRLASVALGTGDIDCVYHMALPELLQAVNLALDNASRGQRRHYQEQHESLKAMVDGGRLRDISDLPFDLAI